MTPVTQGAPEHPRSCLSTAHSMFTPWGWGGPPTGLYDIPTHSQLILSLRHGAGGMRQAARGTGQTVDPAVPTTLWEHPRGRGRSLRGPEAGLEPPTPSPFQNSARRSRPLCVRAGTAVGARTALQKGPCSGWSDSGTRNPEKLQILQNTEESLKQGESGKDGQGGTEREASWPRDKQHG